MGEAYFPDQNEDFAAIHEKLARRRKLAEQLVAQGMSQDIGQGYQGGRVYAVGNPLGNIAQSIGGTLLNRMADNDQQDLSTRQRQAEEGMLSAIPAEGPERGQAQLKAFQQMPSLRDAIKVQMGLDEHEATRQFRQQEAEAARLEKSEQEAANRVARAEEGAANRQNRLDARAMPTIHISQGGGRGGVKAPAGYRYNEDGTALEPIPGGPADPNNAKGSAPKPLTPKQLETQRGFMDMASSLNNYEKLLDSYDFQGKAAIDPAARAALEGAYTDVQMKLKTIYELGAPQAGDLKLLAQSIPNPTDMQGTLRGAAFGSAPFKAKLNETRKLLTSSQANFEKQLGKVTPEPAKPPQSDTLTPAEQAELDQLRAKHGRK